MDEFIKELDLIAALNRREYTAVTKKVFRIFQ